MKKVCLTPLFILLYVSAIAQSIKNRLDPAIQKFLSDVQMKHAVTGIYIIDAKTGKSLAEINAHTGLAPASTQKLIISATAYELLGKDYRYHTGLYHDGQVVDGTLNGKLYLKASGDPTFGSWRWKETSEESIGKKIREGLAIAGIRNARNKSFYIVNPGFADETFPAGYIWQDIGNYYGAYHAALNWRENQFDLFFNTGIRIGDPVEFDSYKPLYTQFTIQASELKTAAKGSGDNAYIFLDPNNGGVLHVRGTLPAGEKKFSISGAHADPAGFFHRFLISETGRNGNISVFKEYPLILSSQHIPPILLPVAIHQSPQLDSINYWFMKKSINLYGEAFARTIGLHKTGEGSLEKGLEVIRSFWKENGIPEDALNILDGSGLSPQNRLTAHSLVTVLKYARNKSWYKSFYHSFPDINGMRMKSGSIGGVRAYAGYHSSRSGNEYIYAIIVNNYSGSSYSIVRKMWAVLDVLK